MKVKNISSRLHHVGDVSIIPDAVAEIDDDYAGSVNSAELVAVVAEAPVQPAPVAPAKSAAKGSKTPAPVVEPVASTAPAVDPLQVTSPAPWTPAQ